MSRPKAEGGVKHRRKFQSWCIFWGGEANGGFEKKSLSKKMSFLYVRKDSIMLSEQSMLFSPIELKLFFWAFQTSWTKKLPITYMSVILWPFCLCNASCVIISISKYLRISTKFDTNFPQFNTSGSFFVLFSIFTIFIDFFSFLGLS